MYTARNFFFFFASIKNLPLALTMRCIMILPLFKMLLCLLCLAGMVMYGWLNFRARSTLSPEHCCKIGEVTTNSCGLTNTTTHCVLWQMQRVSLKKKKKSMSCYQVSFTLGPYVAKPVCCAKSAKCLRRDMQHCFAVDFVIFSLRGISVL